MQRLYGCLDCVHRISRSSDASGQVVNTGCSTDQEDQSLTSNTKSWGQVSFDIRIVVELLTRWSGEQLELSSTRLALGVAENGSILVAQDWLHTSDRFVLTLKQCIQRVVGLAFSVPDQSIFVASYAQVVHLPHFSQPRLIDDCSTLR